jgi:hypothetical protein
MDGTDIVQRHQDKKVHMFSSTREQSDPHYGEIVRFCSSTCVHTLTVRIEDCITWWHHNGPQRSGGINSLGIVLRGAPNLWYLSIASVVGTNQIRMESGQMVLSNLELLRLHIRSGLLLQQVMSRWSPPPSLTYLIMDSPLVEGGLNAIWETFG